MVLALPSRRVSGPAGGAVAESAPDLAAPSRAGGRRGEIRALTGLRFIAALWVVLVHFQTALAQAFGARVSLLTPLILSGWLGVDLFFVLSGFVMVLTYVETMGPRWHLRAAVTFLWLRLARIWPLWAVLTVLEFSWHRLLGYPAAQGGSVAGKAMIEQLLLVQMWHRSINLGSSLILPGWSLSVEFLAYLAFPLLVLVFWRLRRLSPVLLACLAVGAMTPLAVIALRTGHTDFLLPWPVRIAGAFISGGLTCLFVNRVRDSVRIRRAASSVSVVAILQILTICYWAQNRVDAGGSDQRGIAVVVLPVLVGSLALASSGPARLLSRESLVLGGRISFALYLVHYCFMDVGAYLQAHVGGIGPSSAKWTLVQAQQVFLAVLAAYVLWRFVEEPSRRFMRRVGPDPRGMTETAVTPAPQTGPGQTERIPRVLVGTAIPSPGDAMSAASPWIPGDRASTPSGS